MLRILKIACAAAMLAWMPSPARVISLAEKIVAGYTDLSIYKGNELKACTATLQTFLTHQPLKSGGAVCHDCMKEVTLAMRDYGCFDVHSDLMTFSNEAAPAGTKEVKSVKEIQVSLIERSLMISVPSLDEDEVGKYIGRQIEAGIIRLPDGWRKKVSDVILDLSRDKGGKLTSFAEVMEVFSPGPGIRYGAIPFKETAILPGYREREQITKGRGMLAGIPVIVAVSNETASFAELIAMTLRHDWNRGKSEIVGATKTWGKTESQCFRDINNFVLLKVTCAAWRVAGIDIRGVGIEPDRYVNVVGCKDLRCLHGRVHGVQAEAQPR